MSAILMLPVGLFGTFALPHAPRAAPPITPLAVQTESITERRVDADTFRRRWPAELPPAVVIREVRVVAETAAPVPTLSPRPVPHITKRVSLDICSKHGMRRVDYGRRWRCRRI